jgi:hypothetical protein
VHSVFFTSARKKIRADDEVAITCAGWPDAKPRVPSNRLLPAPLVRNRTNSAG